MNFFFISTPYFGCRVQLDGNILHLLGCLSSSGFDRTCHGRESRERGRGWGESREKSRFERDWMMGKSAYALAAVAVVACTMTGCTQNAGDELPHTSPTEASVGGIKFQGPWASSFAQEFRDATRKDVRQALQDGKITDAEYAYFESEIVRCLSGIGVKDARLTDGRWQYVRPDSVPDSKVDDCMRSNGIQVMGLRDSVVANPSNIDQDAALVACLVRKEAVPKGYSVKDYKRELAVNKYSFDLNSKAFSECNENPLDQ